MLNLAFTSAPHLRRGQQRRWTPYSNGLFTFDCRRDTEINLSTGALANSLHSKTGTAGVELGRLALCAHCSSSDARDRRTPWQGSQAARSYVRARLAGIIQADLSASLRGVQSYRRHGTGQGRTYRLRGSVTQPEGSPFERGNEDHALPKAGKQSGTALIRSALQPEPRR